MERTSSSDPEAEARGDRVLEHLHHSLQLLASPAQAQLSHFPAGWVVLTDEMALDFNHWAQCLSTYWEPSNTQTVQLKKLDDFLSAMSGSLHSAFWTDEALSSDPRWEEVRMLAKTALLSFGWTIAVPPPAQQEHGMLVDNGSYILSSHDTGSCSNTTTKERF
ncbi:hypothetical protein [Dictyobacter formicarum]|uniref:Uncharacterized protein n=1 Tax=Dictyobacter formicarum TaxID=2778368 RepID=A0ABQ3VSY5_9CHLR|nr:hypothetical protein [Dictyobacter formicarum]GHO89399.1 hypothetical protein KSZ_74050 [Dictyobacter formicarum]